jgi:hydroxypyruvate isomerase
LIGRLNRPNLKLMFDCYHVARMGLEVMKELKTAMPHIGHIQFAAVPDRSEPDHGTVDYRTVFGFLDAIGYDRPLGAEYRPSGGVEAGLGWLKQANSE